VTPTSDNKSIEVVLKRNVMTPISNAISEGFDERTSTTIIERQIANAMSLDFDKRTLIGAQSEQNEGQRPPRCTDQTPVKLCVLLPMAKCEQP
jgi:hypothetical protein